jgi:predicted nucleic acid-binding protein
VIVVDASVVIEMLLQTDDGIAIADRLITGAETLHAPHLIDLEVAQVLRRYVLRGEVKAERALQALQVMIEFPLTRYDHEPLLSRIWELRENLTAYDGAYVALAEGLNATLVTRDRKLSAVPVLRGAVELV